jgi:hypothetical protein
LGVFTWGKLNRPADPPVSPASSIDDDDDDADADDFPFL